MAEQTADSKRVRGDRHRTFELVKRPSPVWDRDTMAHRAGPIIYKKGPFPPAKDLPNDVELQIHPEVTFRTREPALVAVRQHALDHGFDMVKAKQPQNTQTVTFHCHHRHRRPRQCPYACRVEREGRGQWTIKVVNEEHNHGPDRSLGRHMWQVNLTSDEEVYLENLQRRGYADTVQRARSVFNVRRSRAGKPRLRDDELIQYHWDKTARRARPWWFKRYVPKMVVKERAAASSSTITAPPSSLTATAAYSSSTVPRASRGASPSELSPRHSCDAAPSPFFPNKPWLPSDSPTALPRMASPGPPPHTATRFGSVPPITSLLRTAAGRLHQGESDSAPFISTLSSLGPEAAAALELEHGASLFEHEQRSEEDSDDRPRDETTTLDDAFEEVREDLPSSHSASTALAQGDAEQPQDQRISDENHLNANHLDCTDALFTCSPQADGLQFDDEVMRDAGSSIDQPATAQQVDGQGRTISNANSTSTASGRSNDGGEGCSRRGRGEGGGNDEGDGESNAQAKASPSSSRDVLLQAVQRGAHLGFITPGDEGGVSFGRTFDPSERWAGFETYTETTQDDSKALPASSQSMDIATSSLLPGGGRLMRVTRTTWVLLARAGGSGSDGGGGGGGG